MTAVVKSIGSTPPRENGTIPTYFDSCKGSDWVNCMVYVADRLKYLAPVCR